MNPTHPSNLRRHPGGAIAIDGVAGCDTEKRFAIVIQEFTAPNDGNGAPAEKPRRSLRILCIDDDPQVRELVIDCLGYFGHQVSVAPSGKAGLESFRAAQMESQPYDVVVTDLGMPGVDGRQVARTIKTESPGTPVIMLTGWGAMIKEDGEPTPAVDVVVNKPPRMQELNELLLRVARPA